MMYILSSILFFSARKAKSLETTKNPSIEYIGKIELMGKENIVETRQWLSRSNNIAGPGHIHFPYVEKPSQL